MTDTPRATDTLMPQAVKVVLGTADDAETYTITSFCLAKTIRTFALLSDLGQAVGASDALSAVTGTAGEETNSVLPNLLKKALAVLPMALRSGEPALYRLLGVLVTSNAKLRRMDEEGEDIDEMLLKLGRDIAYRATNDQIIDLLIKSVSVIGVETIVKNLPGLLALMGARS